uniref:Uncharacterized protein n=1 Tax=Utricularia reniformis TaxID=192314 RepID=A0A1Y0B1C2_9LAMI|nr:hypothetical protein AEK19_MT0949 [Utricularia reniformis]ART31174.1 hypothetical protein AEK19_MT0949 [Utricularia reniformis]
MCENCYICSYFESNTASFGDDWKPPRNAAVQIAAAITATAGIYMHPYIEMIVSIPILTLWF